MRGVRELLGRWLRVATGLPDENAILLGKVDSIKRAVPIPDAGSGLKQDGYVLKTVAAGGKSYLVITASNDRGVLYGSFALLRKIGPPDPIQGLGRRPRSFAPLENLGQMGNLERHIQTRCCR